MLPSTVDRVPRHTAPEVNQRIRVETERQIARAISGGPAVVNRRLAELDREWDIERVLEANAASAVLVGTVLGATADRKFYLVPLIVGGFLLQHALQGWCPPLALFRRLGVRTASEIDYERDRLRAHRADAAG